MDWERVFAGGLGYFDFLARHGSDAHRRRWDGIYEQVQLSEEQRGLLAGFRRRMNVLCLAGAWCGDCAGQCPIFQRFTEASSVIDLRFLDRDADPAVSRTLSINGGQRVPVVVFLSEDFYECGRYGDRTLSRYRAMAAAHTGTACPTGLADPAGLLTAVTAEWLNEFERIQWMLLLSPRLRTRHGD